MTFVTMIEESCGYNRCINKLNERRMTVNKPEFVTDKVLEYLDDLRESAVTNMFLAASYLVQEFGFDKREARRALRYWMDTFGDDNR